MTSIRQIQYLLNSQVFMNLKELFDAASFTYTYPILAPHFGQNLDSLRQPEEHVAL